ncbi:MAG: HDOD domain-containing protein [Myxococcota bacterium]
MRRHANYGRGEHTIAGADAEALETVVTIRKRLQQVLADPGYKPPMLPQVALEVHELSKQPTVDLDAVIDLISQDAVLATQVLRRAQSSVYATRVPPRSLEDAVRRLGLANIRDVVWEVALGMRVFRCKPYRKAMEELRAHSVATARCAKAIASYTSVGEDYAFLAGLLHDVGLAAMLMILGEDRKPLPLKSIANDLFDIHEQATETVGQLWELPADLTLVLSHHHHPNIGGYDHPLIAILCVAEEIAKQLSRGLGWTETSDATHPAQLQRSVDALGIGPHLIEATAKKLAPMME